MANPTLEELRNSGRYELLHELEHQQVKEFVLRQIASGSRLIRYFSVYQGLMILTGLFFITRTVILAFRGNLLPLYYILGAIFFTFTLLILVHELLHALAFKLTGAKRVSIGAYLKKFIFYAEADLHVLNRKQFTLVALTPFVVVKLLSAAGIILSLGNPLMYFWIFMMCIHSLFCAGDIGMLDYFYHYNEGAIYTVDVKKEKKSYFYRAIEAASEDQPIQTI